MTSWTTVSFSEETVVQFPGAGLACPCSDCTYLCCVARCIRRERFRRITTHSFTNVISSHPITESPLHILIDTSSNGNPDHIFVLKARNRAWLHFYSAIQILGTSPFGSPFSCLAPGNGVHILPVPGTNRIGWG
jgi:hypothetical protein